MSSVPGWAGGQQVLGFDGGLEVRLPIYCRTIVVIRLVQCLRLGRVIRVHQLDLA